MWFDDLRVLEHNVLTGIVSPVFLVIARLVLSILGSFRLLFFVFGCSISDGRIAWPSFWISRLGRLLLGRGTTPYAFSPGDHIHPILVKLLHASREITDIELVLETNLEVINLKHKPIHITSGVGIHLHEQVVLLCVMNINWIKVATFEVLIKS